ncbi:hypothetical protein BJP25_26005 [Actinokineospora bangkokensis]|uniref:Low molecular weight protein antigen 6 PH domain-containing protein n=1 Tax=Actinokineospora bangkokensis TaxID=1193682 RepID=A0A1Q9LHW1_9PSEU|nr:hypothetical protein BJP25_26005 [Actinokineospora bangkokensis]
MFRVPGIAVLAPALLAICATPFAFGAPLFWLVYLVPIAITAWVVRVRTVVTEVDVVARTATRTTRFGWERLGGLKLSEKQGVTAVLDDGAEVALPQVRVRHLPALSLMSGGRVPDPTPHAEDPGPAPDQVPAGADQASPAEPDQSAEDGRGGARVPGAGERGVGPAGAE